MKYSDCLIQELRILAEQGDVKAGFHVGVRYEFYQEPSAAAAWYFETASRINTDAQYTFGLIVR